MQAPRASSAEGLDTDEGHTAMLDLLLDLIVTAGAVVGWLLLLLHLAGNAGRYVDGLEAARAARRRHEQFVLVDRWRAEFTAATWRPVRGPRPVGGYSSSRPVEELRPPARLRVEARP